jgi:CRP/FNR family transcriptional regulator
MIVMNCNCRHSDCVLCEGVFGTDPRPAQVCNVPRLVTREYIHPGQSLFSQGESAEWIYVLRDGYVKLSTTLLDGRQQVVCVGNSGHVLGFDGLPAGRHGCTAQALAYVTLCTVRVPDMWRIFERNPEVSRRAILALSRDLERSRTQLCDLGMKSAMERVASYLLRLGCTPQGASISQPLSRAEIAEMLGLTIGTVSRSIVKLQRERIVHAPRGKLRVLDPERLRAIAGEPPMRAQPPAPTVSVQSPVRDRRRPPGLSRLAVS